LAELVPKETEVAEACHLVPAAETGMAAGWKGAELGVVRMMRGYQNGR